MRDTLLRWARFAEVDRAVFVGLLNRMWSLIAGPISLVLIGFYFSPQVQGYHYAFATLLALQVFVELGIGAVIQQFASHEWTKLKRTDTGQVVGCAVALDRLSSIAFVGIKWFGVGGLIASVGLSIGGYLFFASSTDVGVSWQLPWFALVTLTGAVIFLQCFWSILEGCNQVTSLYTYRFYQVIISQSLGWIAIIMGAGIWVAVISTTVTILCALYYLGRFHRTFLLSIIKTKSKAIDSGIWLREMLPFQWRIALSWVSGYFCFSLFVPVLFKFHGAEVAGQMGMTWSLIVIVGTIGGSWLSPRVPQFAMAAAQKDYQHLNSLFWRITRVTFIASCIVALAIYLFVLGLNLIDDPLTNRFSSRLFSPTVVAIFLVAQLLLVISLPFSSYMRAHKQEPLVALSLLAALLIGLSTIILGKQYGGVGVASGYLVAHLIVIPMVIYVWCQKRREWMAM
jgi:O-antigen/teichoic acid export membrane protein